jgi:hypothetical protein
MLLRLRDGNPERYDAERNVDAIMVLEPRPNDREDSTSWRSSSENHPRPMPSLSKSSGRSAAGNTETFGASSISTRMRYANATAVGKGAQVLQAAQEPA